MLLLLETGLRVEQAALNVRSIRLVVSRCVWLL